MTTVLLVVRPFGRHAVGDLITDDAGMRAAQAGEDAQNVVRVAAPPAAPASRKGD